MEFFSVEEGGSGGEQEELGALVAQKEAVAALGLKALSGMKLSSFLGEVSRVVAQTLSVEFCRILELLPDGEKLVLLSGVGWGDGYVGEATVEVTLDTQAGYALVSRDPVVVEDSRKERRFKLPRLLGDHGIVSGLSTAIYSGGRIFGVLGIHTTDSRIFNKEEGRFLEEIAEIVGAAIERKRSEEQARHAIEEYTKKAQAAERRFQFLLEANELLLSPSLDYATTLTTAARLAVPAIAEWCFIDLAEEGGEPHRVVVAHADPEKAELAEHLRNNFPLKENASHATPEVLRTGRAELLPELDDGMLENLARSQEHLQLLRRLEPRSYMCVPLKGLQKAFGSMVFISCARSYGDEELALAEGLSRCVGLALDNVLYLPEMELSRELIRQARGGRGVVTTPSKELPHLTLRQLQVLRLLSDGGSVAGIAEELYISRDTVRNHIRALLKAFGAHSQLEAIARARRAGLLVEN